MQLGFYNVSFLLNNQVFFLARRKRPTAGDSRLGWEDGVTLETGFRQRQEKAQKK